MKTLTIYLIRFPLLQIIFILFGILIIRIFFIESIAYCEGMSNLAVNIAQNTHYVQDPRYEDKNSIEYAKYTTWKTFIENKRIETETYIKNAAILQKNKEESTIKETNDVFKFLEIPKVVKPINYDLIKMLETQTFVNTCHPTVLKVINDISKLNNLNPENYLTLIRETWVKHCNTKLLSNKEICLNLDLLVANSNKNPFIIEVAACYILESAINIEIKQKNISIEIQNEIFHGTIENYMKQPQKDSIIPIETIISGETKVKVIYSLNSLLKKEAFISNCDQELQNVIGKINKLGLKVSRLKEDCTYMNCDIQNIVIICRNSKLDIGNETNTQNVLSLLKITNNPILFHLYCCLQVELIVKFEPNFTESELEEHYKDIKINAIRMLNP